MKRFALLGMIALVLGMLARSGTAADASLLDPSRFSCGVQAGVVAQAARNVENDFEVFACVNPSWNLGTLPAVVAPLKIGIQTQQFSWEPKLSVLAYDGAFQVFAQGGFGFYADLDDDAGVEFDREPVVAAVLVAPLKDRWAIVGNGSQRTRSENRTVSVAVSYLLGGE